MDQTLLGSQKNVVVKRWIPLMSNFLKVDCIVVVADHILDLARLARSRPGTNSGVPVSCLSRMYLHIFMDARA